jgi:hypothetical protein
VLSIVATFAELDADILAEFDALIWPPLPLHAVQVPG